MFKVYKYQTLPESLWSYRVLLTYFQSEKLFQKLKQIQFEGDAFSFMNFRVPDLKKGDVMNAHGGQIVSMYFGNLIFIRQRFHEIFYHF